MRFKIFLFFLFFVNAVFGQTFTVNSILYTIISSSPNKVEVASNNCFAGALILPTTVVNSGKTYTVSSIAGSAFYNCANLTSVSIPNTVTSIGSSAFALCSNLISVSIPNSVTTIGGSVFRNCISLTSITIPDSVTQILSNSFFKCTNLALVNLGNSLTSIGNSAFSGCSNLNSIMIPNSVTIIGDSVFSGCLGLNSITIPNSVTTLGDSAFYNCTSLSSVSISNNLSSIGHSVFQNCTSLLSVSIPNSVTSIGNFAFNQCTNLASLSIPNSVNSIGLSAFANCSSLSAVYCEIITPLVINTDVFKFVNQDSCSLTVHNSSVNAYKSAANWKLFNPILGTPFLSVADSHFKNKLLIYPNPFQNEVFIEVKEIKENSIEIFDFSGKIVLKLKRKSSQQAIDTSILPKGTYLFKVGSSISKGIKK